MTRPPAAAHVACLPRTILLPLKTTTTSRALAAAWGVGVDGVLVLAWVARASETPDRRDARVTDSATVASAKAGDAADSGDTALGPGLSHAAADGDPGTAPAGDVGAPA